MLRVTIVTACYPLFTRNIDESTGVRRISHQFPQIYLPGECWGQISCLSRYSQNMENLRYVPFDNRTTHIEEGFAGLVNSQAGRLDQPTNRPRQRARTDDGCRLGDRLTVPPMLMMMMMSFGIGQQTTLLGTCYSLCLCLLSNHHQDCIVYARVGVYLGLGQGLFINLYPSGIWRTCAGVCVCLPAFRTMVARFRICAIGRHGRGAVMGQVTMGIT